MSKICYSRYINNKSYDFKSDSNEVFTQNLPEHRTFSGSQTSIKDSRVVVVVSPGVRRDENSQIQSCICSSSTVTWRHAACCSIRSTDILHSQWVLHFQGPFFEKRWSHSESNYLQYRDIIRKNVVDGGMIIVQYINQLTCIQIVSSSSIQNEYLVKVIVSE